MSTSPESQILLVANRRDDQTKIVDLLDEIGYTAEIYPDFSTLTEPANGVRRRDDAHATIICHRRINEADAAELPATLPGARVIVFSDCRSEDSICNMLELGAHQYFDIDESRRVMLARLEAALRYHSRPARASFEFADFHFDLQKRRVMREQETVDLSPKEFDFALYLFSHRDRIVGNSELMTSVWSLPPSMDTRRIDTAACRVRKKMRLTEEHGWRLKRLRREGYQLIHLNHLGRSATPGATGPSP